MHRTFDITPQEAKQWHEGRLKNRSAVTGLPSSCGKFYVQQAKVVWKTFFKVKGNDSFLSIMKHVQLNKCRCGTRNTVLVVDEVQDLNACQMNWILHQALFAVQVVLVGDPRQGT